MATGRTFDGTDDRITLAPGACTTAFGPATVVAIIKRNSTVDNEIIGGFDGAGATDFTWIMGLDDNAAGNDLYLFIPDVGSVLAPTIAVPNSDNWVLIAITKASGTVAPRFHEYVYDTDTWTHENGASNIANGPATSNRLQLGEVGDFFGGDLLICGFWTSVLSDVAIETLKDSLSAWEALTPTGLWLLNQTNVADDVLDLTGGGANETAITGTTVGTNDLPDFVIEEEGGYYLQENGTDRYLLEDGTGLYIMEGDFPVTGEEIFPTGDITSAGALIKSVTKKFVGTLTPTGALLKSSTQLFTGAITPAGALTLLHNFFRAFTGSITPTGALITLKQFTRAFTGSITPTGALTTIKSAIRFFTGAITPAGALVKTVSKLLAGTIAPAGALRKTVGKLFTGAIVCSGAVLKRLSKSPTGSITATGALATIKSVVRFFTASITPIGAFAKIKTLRLIGSITPTGNSIKRIGKLFTGSIAPVGSLLKRLSKFFQGLIAPIGEALVGIFGVADRVSVVISDELITSATLSDGIVTMAVMVDQAQTVLTLAPSVVTRATLSDGATTIANVSDVIGG